MPETLPPAALPTLAAIAVYLVATAATGLLARRRAEGEAGFYLAGRSLGPVAASSTLAATAIGGSATIMVIGQVFSRGLPAIWIDLAGGTGLILLGLLLAAKVRRLGLFSLPEIAGHFYGQAVRRVAGALVLLAQVGWLGILLKACVSLLQPLLGIHPLALLISVGGVFILYTVIGGQLAVARTDVVQLALMAAGILLVAVPLLIGEAEWQKVPASLWQFPAGPEFPLWTLLPLILIYGLPHLVGSDIYGKLLSARDERVARLSAIVAGGLKIAFGIAAGLIGLAAAGILPPETPADEVLTTLVAEVLSPPAAALLAVAFLATLMSSADSVLLTASTVLNRDLLRLRGATAGRIAVAIIGSLGIVFALLFSSLLDIFFFAYTLFSAGLSLPVLLGFWRDKLRLNTAGAAASMLGGAGAVVLATVARWPAELVTAGGLGSSCALLFAVSFVTRRRERNR